VIEFGRFEQAAQDAPGTSFGEAIEIGPRPSLLGEREGINVTKETLLADNHSPEAQQGIALWRDTRENHKLIVIDKCSDARSFEDEPETKVILPSIAASGPVEPFDRVYQDPKVQAIVTESHYSSKLAKRGENPPGCGGRGGKAAQKNGGPIEGDVQKFIRDHVPHEDVVVNSLYRAGRLADITRKPVLATAQDHITGQLKPLAWFNVNARGNVVGESAIPYHLLFEGGYDPHRIYENGVPELPIEASPDVFAQLVMDNTAHLEQLKERFPDFTKAQEVQNPKTLLLSTSTKPARIRYPKIFGLPGTFFSLRFGRERIDGGDIVDPASMHEALNQAHFAIHNSTANHDTDRDFARLNTVLIETSNLDTSLELAVELGQKPWMQEWMQLPNHKILLARTRAGVTDHIEALT